MKVKVDGKEYEINEGENGFALAKLVNESLVKDAVSYKIGEEVFDMTAPIKEGEVSFITKNSVEGLNILRHSTSHLLAHAIKRLYPDAKFAIGPYIEEGFYYDIDFPTPITDADFASIEKEMKKISKENLKIVKKEVSKEEALELFKDNPYKIELIKELEGKILIREQGDFVDLCGGNHVPSTGYIKNFKLLSLAGAYWRGDSKNKQLTRIYGTSFYTPEELENHLKILEERKARDHRKLGKELELFLLSDYGPGFPFWLPNGMILREQIEQMWKQIHTKYGYLFIKTPQMLNKELWITSGHWDHYQDNMYTTSVDDEEYAIKPMNCPGSIIVYKSSLHSYKDLPLRYAELGLVHRKEASGALNGLFRVRAFTQDDAHTYVSEETLEQEIKDILKLYDEIYSIFGLEYKIELSTRPEGYIGDIAIWDKSEKILEDICRKSNKEFKINPGDGAFYGPKLDFKVRDSMNRVWQCGTIQLDMNLPERFDLTYVDKDGLKKRPIMIHRACFGSIERFVGVITEHYAGAFPTWIAPTQVNILPVNNEHHLEYSKKVLNELLELNVRAKLDDSSDKLGYKLRQSQIKKIPYTIVIGDNEVKNNSVTYRLYGTNEQITVSLDDFKALILKSIKERSRF